MDAVAAQGAKDVDSFLSERIRVAVEPQAKRRGGVARFTLILSTVSIALLGSQTILLCC